MKVKGCVAAGLAAGMLVLAAPAPVARARRAVPPRTVGYAYRCSPCGVGFGPFGAAPANGVSFWPGAREHYLGVEIGDESRERIAFEVWQAGADGSRFVGRGCGETGPLLIEPGREVTIFPLTGACIGNGRVSLARPTTGTVWATFSARRGALR